MIRTRYAVSSSLDGGREFGLQAELDETISVSLVTNVKLEDLRAHWVTSSAERGWARRMAWLVILPFQMREW